MTNRRSFFCAIAGLCSSLPFVSWFGRRRTVEAGMREGGNCDAEYDGREDS